MAKDTAGAIDLEARIDAAAAHAAELRKEAADQRRAAADQRRGLQRLERLLADHLAVCPGAQAGAAS